MHRTRISLLLGAAMFLATAPRGFAATADLSGQVTSAKEGAMEGVLVTAKKDGSNISTTVVSDDKGHYTFPGGRLKPGHYTLKIRAIGYVLGGPEAVDVTNAGAVANLKLTETTNVAPQLTNAEWLASAPGADDVKKASYGCGTCHTLSLPLSSTHTKDDFVKVIFPRMAQHASQAFPTLVQDRINALPLGAAAGLDRLATFLASANLSATPEYKYAFKALPRPQGKNTHVIITSYDLPRKTMQPHDVVRTPDGFVWFTDFGENSLSRLDPETGKVTEYTYPPTRPGYSNGNLDLEIDGQGNIWIGMMNQTGVAKFDRKTEKFQFFSLPAALRTDDSQQAMVAPTHWEVDGKVWFAAGYEPVVGRFDVKTGKFEPWIYPFKDRPKGEAHAVYGVYTDSKNNLYFCDFLSQYIWKIDAKTRAVTAYPTPTEHSQPRRGRMDTQDRLWFGEWRADKVGMFDTKTDTFKEWNVAPRFSAPYDAQVDKAGWVWTGNMTDDRVTRINSKTGETIQYLMPIESNLRRVSVDNSDVHPALWVGSNHQATVMKIEPLE